MNKIISSLSQGDLAPFQGSTAVRIFNLRERTWRNGIRHSIAMQNKTCVLRISPHEQYTTLLQRDPESFSGDFIPNDAVGIKSTYFKLIEGRVGQEGDFREQPYFLHGAKKVEFEDIELTDFLIIRYDVMIIALSARPEDYIKSLTFLKRNKPSVQ